MMKVLDLRHNKIITLDEDVFKDLTNLKKIDLSDNLITFLPNNIFTSMYHLSKFIANDNFIELFDSDIFQYNRKLEDVHLWRNNVKAIRFDSKKLRRLQVFDVRQNVCIDEIFYVPSDFSTFEIQNKINVKCSSYVKVQGRLVYRRSGAFKRTQ